MALLKCIFLLQKKENSTHRRCNNTCYEWQSDSKDGVSPAEVLDERTSHDPAKKCTQGHYRTDP